MDNDITVHEAREYFAAVKDEHPAPDTIKQILMFWRGIITLSEFTAATGIADSQAAIFNLQREVEAWLLS